MYNILLIVLDVQLTLMGKNMKYNTSFMAQSK